MNSYMGPSAMTANSSVPFNSPAFSQPTYSYVPQGQPQPTWQTASLPQKRQYIYNFPGMQQQEIYKYKNVQEWSQQQPGNFQQHTGSFQQQPITFQQQSRNFQQQPRVFQQQPRNFQQHPATLQQMPLPRNLHGALKTAPFANDYAPSQQMRGPPMMPRNMQPPPYGPMQQSRNPQSKLIPTISYYDAINGPKMGHSMVPFGSEVPDEGITFMI